MNVSGHAAIVSGGASGLGAETARHLARAGAKVAVLDVNMSEAEKVAAEIGGLAAECDVSDAASAEAAVGRARAAHGPARVAVVCAGIAPPKRIVGFFQIILRVREFDLPESRDKRRLPIGAKFRYS